MKKERFCRTLSVISTLLSLTLLLTAAQAKISTGETFTAKVTFNETANPPFPSSAEIRQGIQTAEYGGGAYFPAGVKISAISRSSTSEMVTVKITFQQSGNLLQPFPSSAEVSQGIQTADYAGGVYIPSAVQVVAVSDLDPQNSGVSASGNPACAPSQNLTLTIETVGGKSVTHLDEFSCTAGKEHWYFGFNAAGGGSIEVRHVIGRTVSKWQEAVVLGSNAVYNGCDEQDSNCWQFDQTQDIGFYCRDCHPPTSNVNLLGTLTFPATLNDVRGPDLVEPDGASGIK